MPEADYQHWVENGLSMLENTRQNWSTYPPERHHIAYYGIGTDARMVAVGYLMLGRLAAARAAFRECAEGFSKGVDPLRDNVGAEISGLEAAMLTGDRAFWNQIAAATPEMTAKKKPVAYPYPHFLKATILGDKAAASRWADELMQVDPAQLAKRGWYGTAGELCKAIDLRDGEKARTALADLLAEHAGKARSAWRNLPQGAVCFTGAALLVLARDLGLPVEVTSPYIPASLL